MLSAYASNLHVLSNSTSLSAYLHNWSVGNSNDRFTVISTNLLRRVVTQFHWRPSPMQTSQIQLCIYFFVCWHETSATSQSLLINIDAFPFRAAFAPSMFKVHRFGRVLVFLDPPTQWIQMRSQSCQDVCVDSDVLSAESFCCQFPSVIRCQ